MRLLIYEPTYRRLEAAIAAQGPGVEPLLINDAGEIRLDGAIVAEDEAAPEAALANGELFAATWRPKRCRTTADPKTVLAT
jgi:hypothetical protein